MKLILIILINFCVADYCAAQNIFDKVLKNRFDSIAIKVNDEIISAEAINDGVVKSMLLPTINRLENKINSSFHYFPNDSLFKNNIKSIEVQYGFVPSGFAINPNWVNEKYIYKKRGKYLVCKSVQKMVIPNYFRNQKDTIFEKENEKLRVELKTLNAVLSDLINHPNHTQLPFDTIAKKVNLIPKQPVVLKNGLQLFYGGSRCEDCPYMAFIIKINLNDGNELFTTKVFGSVNVGDETDLVSVLNFVYDAKFLKILLPPNHSLVKDYEYYIKQTNFKKQFTN
jgi:hypothetical protein